MLVRLHALVLAASVLSGSTWVTAFSASDVPSDTPVSQLLELAQSHLSKGQTNNALVYYDAAVARDPSNYLTFFKRATTFLSLGRMNQATDDFNKVLSLKPGFEGAHLQLGKIKARSGEWQSAREQFQRAGKKAAAADLARLGEARGAATSALAAQKKGDWEECIIQTNAALSLATRSSALREMRAQCHLERGDFNEGINDLQTVLSLRPGNVSPHLVISAIAFYTLAEPERAISVIRKCLQSDPDFKPCKKILKEIKAIDKAVQKAATALEREQHITTVRQLVKTGEDEGLIERVKKHEAELRQDGIFPKTARNALLTRLVDMACHAYFESSSKKASEWCELSLQLDDKSLYGLLHRAKKQQDADDFEAAVHTYKKALDAHSDKQDKVKPLINQAQIALKRSKTKDYYKVLGVAHDADEKQIKSAYRKMSKMHHPDKAVKQGLNKEKAEKKMAAINEAYEVLSSPELRARFDAGDDPNSQEPRGGGHPFGSGGGGGSFVFQQGGGQNFHFNFRSGGGGGGFQGGFPGGFPFG